MNSYLTQDELDLLQIICPNRSAPFAIAGVSHSQFSIARHYGGIVFKGFKYVYNPATDELIRPDVLKIITKRRRDQAKNRDIEAAAKQGRLI